jgi:hypothetical protein
LGYCSLDPNCTCPAGGTCADTVEPTSCTTAPPAGTCVSLDPSVSWASSPDDSTWTATVLPYSPDFGGLGQGWGDNTNYYFQATFCGEPTAVYFRWGSDNDAQMLVNGTVAYDAWWGSPGGVVEPTSAISVRATRTAAL